MKLNNKGMTLVELIVAIAVTAIIMVAIGGVFYSSFRIFGNITNANEDKLIGDTVYEWLTEKMSKATDTEIISEQDIVINGTDTLTLSNNGRLLYNDNDIYGDALYMDSSISFSITKYNDNAVNITVEVLRDGEINYKVGSVVKMLNYKFTP